MLDPQREIQALVDHFVADLGALAKRIAIEQIRTAFSAGTLLSAPPGAKPRGRAVGARRATASRAAAPAPAPAPTRGRTRRAQGELEELRDKLLAAVAEKPGRRTEELNVALGTRTPQIAQLLRGLVAEQRIRTEGARRGTRYFLTIDGPSMRRAESSAGEQPQAT